MSAVSRGQSTTALAGQAREARTGELVISSERWRLGVLPGLGGCWSFGQVQVDGRWEDLLRPTPDEGLLDPEATSSFPLLPWSNRIRGGVLEWGGERFQLVRNGADGSAIHGAVRQLPWSVDAQSEDSLELRFSTADVIGVNWPWRFSARQVLAVRGGTLEVRLELTNDDDVAFPAGLGHHPYFQRRLGEQDAELQLDAAAGYELEAGMALGEAGEVPARANYLLARPLGEEFVDDVLTELGPVPARWRYPDVGVEVSLRADPAFSHLVVYEPVGRDHFAVEPVTHVNDGIGLLARGVPGTGVEVLEPGSSLAATFSLTVTAR